jgi:hypothetical protein
MSTASKHGCCVTHAKCCYRVCKGLVHGVWLDNTLWSDDVRHGFQDNSRHHILLSSNMTALVDTNSSCLTHISRMIIRYCGRCSFETRSS